MMLLTVGSRSNPSTYLTPYCRGVVVQQVLRMQASNTSDDVTVCVLHVSLTKQSLDLGGFTHLDGVPSSP